MQGAWEGVDQVATSPDLGLSDEQLSKVRYVVKKQEFLELLEGKEVGKAVECLQTHLTPLAPNSEEVHKLARLLVCGDTAELHKRAEWQSAKLTRHQVLKHVEACLPCASLVPAGRLQTLVAQSLQHQMKSCTRYNSTHHWTNLLEDCRAGDEMLPTRTRLVLEHHSDEVWHMEFSHCGRYLASASKDKSVIIWSLHELPRVKHELKAHTDAVSYVAWSRCDKWLLSGGNDLVVKLWDTRTGVLVRDFMRHTEAVTAMAWLDGHGHFVTGSYDKQLITWHMDSTEPRDIVEGQRVTDLSVSEDGRRLVIMTADNKMLMMALPSMELLPNAISQALGDKESITSVSLSTDSRYLLLNVSSHSRPEVPFQPLSVCERGGAGGRG